MRARGRQGFQRGFSLIELIAALAISGMIGTALLLWLSRPLEALVDSHDRAAAIDASERVFARLRTELDGALPNSVRIACSGRCLEFIPVVDVGDYRSATPGNELDFSIADDSFDVLKPLGNAPQPGTRVVINNLNAQPTGSVSAYSGDSNNNRSTITAAATADEVHMTAKQFPAPSPSQRFFLIASPVSYLCSPQAGGGTLRRHAAYGLQPAQPTDTNLGDLLAEDVVACRFGQTGDVVTVRLTLGNSTAELPVFMQVHQRFDP